MVILDYIIIAIILLFGVWGWRKGFLISVGGILGLILGSIIASRFYPIVGQWFGGSNISQIIAFLLIFALVVKLISLIFWLLGKIFQIVTVLPFLSSIDSIIGLILGLAEGIFVAAITIYFMNKYPINDWFRAQMPQSFLAAKLLLIAKVFVPLFPEAFKKLKTLI